MTTATTWRLVLRTALGSIEIDVDETRAPHTAPFVRRLVENRCYDGASFYRSTTLGNEARDPLIQGGPFAPLFTDTNAPIPPIDLLETVDSTDHSGLAHRRGTVSLARDLLTTGHVLPELFICLDDYPELDAGGRSEPDAQGFPAFGTIAAGLDVVTAIAQRERAGASPVELLAGQVLTEPVTIISATIGEPTTESRS